MNSQTLHYDPWATVAYIEVLLNVSYRTARRRLADAKAAFGIESRGRLTESQVRNFFC